MLTKKPTDFESHSKVKLFATLQKLVFDVIPEDPARESFLLGNTLGPENRAWRRAKFSQQYRLFFRFDPTAKIIIYAWVWDALLSESTELGKTEVEPIKTVRTL